jgi:hypothetical protein
MPCHWGLKGVNKMEYEIDYPAFFKAVQNWQVNEMGNNCALCWGNNIRNQCIACGWWGKVNPNDPECKNGCVGPDIDDYKFVRRGFLK